MTYCGEHTLVKLRPEIREATTLLCRSWLCQHCYESRKAQLIAQAHRGKANTFVTITSRREEWKHPDIAAAEIAWAWRTITKRALREARRDPQKNPRPFGAAPKEGWGPTPTDGFPPKVKLINNRLEYLVVIEAHESGWPHAHIMCRCEWLAWSWLSAQMDDLLGSPVCRVQRIKKRAQVAAYIAKYCGKCTHKFGNTKRYWMTRGYQLEKYEKPESPIIEWHDVERMSEHINSIAARWQTHGYLVSFESTWHLVAERPGGES